MEKKCKVYKGDDLIFEGNMLEVAEYLGLAKSTISRAVSENRPTKNGYLIVYHYIEKESKYGAEIERRLKLYGNTCFQNHKDEILKYLDSKGIQYKIKWYEFPKEKGFCENKRGRPRKNGNWYIELI